MKYPLDFVDAVLGQFPEYSYLQKMFEQGSPNIGRFLDDQIAYLDALDFDDVVKTHHIRKWEVERDLEKIRKLYEQYGEIAARQKDYAAPNTIFRSIPVK